LSVNLIIVAELGLLRLRTLDIGHNQLKELPVDLRHLTTLTTLTMEHNPFADSALQMAWFFMMHAYAQDQHRRANVARHTCCSTSTRQPRRGDFPTNEGYVALYSILSGSTPLPRTMRSTPTYAVTRRFALCHSLDRPHAH
jgi:hypothetical protein